MRLAAAAAAGFDERALAAVAADYVNKAPGKVRLVSAPSPAASEIAENRRALWPAEPDLEEPFQLAPQWSTAASRRANATLRLTSAI